MLKITYCCSFITWVQFRLTILRGLNFLESKLFWVCLCLVVQLYRFSKMMRSKTPKNMPEGLEAVWKQVYRKVDGWVKSPFDWPVNNLSNSVPRMTKNHGRFGVSWTNRIFVVHVTLLRVVRDIQLFMKHENVNKGWYLVSQSPLWLLRRDQILN